MSATLTKLTRRTQVVEHDDCRVAGVTHLFGPTPFAEPRDNESFAVVVFAVDRASGKATAAAVTEAGVGEMFDGDLLSSVLLEAFAWVEAEAAR